MFNLKAPTHNIQTRHYHITKSRLIYADSSADQVYFQSQLNADPLLSDLRAVCLNISQPDSLGNYICCTDNSVKQSRNLWMLCGTEHSPNDQPIQAGEIYRVGRQVIKFKTVPSDSQRQSARDRSELRANNDFSNRHSHQKRDGAHLLNSPPCQKENSSPNRFQTLNTNQSKHQQTNQLVCRICLEPETSDLEFEPDLCFCSRKMPAHTECIIKWMSKKCEKWKKSGVAFYDLTLLFCDICKQKYPGSVKHKGVDRQILDTNFAFGTPYAIIEAFENESTAVNAYFIIQMPTEDQKFIIGRHEQNDLSFRDISVSRQHATLLWKRGRLFLYDNDSKFGTLKLVQEKHYLCTGVRNKFVVDKFMFDVNVFKRSRDCECVENHVSYTKNPEDNLALQAMRALRIVPSIGFREERNEEADVGGVELVEVEYAAAQAQRSAQRVDLQAAVPLPEDPSEIIESQSSPEVNSPPVEESVQNSSFRLDNMSRVLQQNYFNSPAQLAHEPENPVNFPQLLNQVYDSLIDNARRETGDYLTEEISVLHAQNTPQNALENEPIRFDFTRIPNAPSEYEIEDLSQDFRPAPETTLCEESALRVRKL